MHHASEFTRVAVVVVGVLTLAAVIFLAAGHPVVAFILMALLVITAVLTSRHYASRLDKRMAEIEALNTTVREQGYAQAKAERERDKAFEKNCDEQREFRRQREAWNRETDERMTQLREQIQDLQNDRSDLNEKLSAARERGDGIVRRWMGDASTLLDVASQIFTTDAPDRDKLKVWRLKISEVLIKGLITLDESDLAYVLREFERHFPDIRSVLRDAAQKKLEEWRRNFFDGSADVKKLQRVVAWLSLSREQPVARA